MNARYEDWEFRLDNGRILLNYALNGMVSSIARSHSE